MYINETNMVYRVQGNKLIPVSDSWGQLLKHDLLNSKQVRVLRRYLKHSLHVINSKCRLLKSYAVLLQMFVLDFGSEVYLWTGKQVAFASRKIGLKLLEEIWKKGYDYSNCDINPLSPLTSESS